MSVKNVIGAVSVPGARSAVAVKSQILDYSRRKATGVSLRDLFIYNAKFDPQQRIRNAQFLHNELPIRLAQRCVELGKLPYGLPEKRGVVDVRAMFDRSFSKLVALPKPQTLADDDALVEVLTGILNDHSEVVASMALGVLEARKEFPNDPQVNERINYYLNRFFMARIGLRFLIEHHIQSKNNAPGFSGILQSDCNPTLVAQVHRAAVQRASANLAPHTPLLPLCRCCPCLPGRGGRRTAPVQPTVRRVAGDQHHGQHDGKLHVRAVAHSLYPQRVAEKQFAGDVHVPRRPRRPVAAGGSGDRPRTLRRDD